MEIWTKKCIACDEEVKYGAFAPCKAKPGNHTLESKTYYHPGARGVADQRDRRNFAPLVILQASYDALDQNTGKFVVKTAGLSVQFFDGKYETDNAELQFHLDNKVGLSSGEEGLKMWREIYLTPEQQTNIAKAELEQLNRRIKEGNDLLAQVKANVKSGKQASA